MDISILAPDEFEVECQVRSIEGDPLTRLASLQIAITNEEKNPVLKPFRAHGPARSAPQRELQKCALKIKEHREFVMNVKPNIAVNENELRKIEVRLLHVKARLERLLSSTKSYKLQCQEHINMVGLVLSGVQTLMQGNDNFDETLNNIKDAQLNDPGDLSTSDEEQPPKRASRNSNQSQANTNPFPDDEDLNEGKVNQMMSSTSIGQPINPDKFPQHVNTILSKWKISFDGDSQKLPIPIPS